MKSCIVRLGLLFLFCASAFAQTLGGNNTWTGTNTYTQYVIAGNGTTGYGFACENMFLSSLDDSCFQLGASATSGTADSQALLFDSYVSGVQQYGTIIQGGDGSFYFQPPNSTIAEQSQPWAVWANIFAVPPHGLEFACQDGPLDFEGGSGTCFYAGSLSTTGAAASQSVEFRALNSTGSALHALIHEDELGNIVLSPSSATTNGEETTNGAVRIVPQVFADWPSCTSSNEGSTATITDSTTKTWGATISGSGSDHVMGYCDGTNWTVMAK